ncbi:MAG: SDR family NAD(P)-dependent oxidoreductase [Bauldia litoralis]
MDVDLTGRVAFVTGAAGGIGRATAERMAACGAAIVVADINGDGAIEVAGQLPKAIAITVDIRDSDAVEAAVAKTVESFGRLDILINNAGVNTFKDRVDIDAFPAEEWRRIVNVASVVGVTAMRLQSAFVAAKAGVIHLTRSMALELGPKGIVVNSIAPGSVMTEGTRQLFYGEDGSFRAQTAAFMKHIPLGRPATVEEIAEGILFLAAPDNSYMTGHLLMVDGGWTAGYML